MTREEYEVFQSIKVLEKKKLVLERLEGKELDCESIAQAANEAFGEGIVDADMVESIFDGVDEGRAFAEENVGKDVKEMLRSALERKVSFYGKERGNGYLIELLQSIYAANKNENIPGEMLIRLSELSDEELFEKTLEALFGQVNLEAGRIMQNTASLMTAVDIEKPECSIHEVQNTWEPEGAQERAVIDAVAMYAQLLEENGDAVEAHFIGQRAAINGYCIERVKDTLEMEKTKELAETIEVAIVSAVGVGLAAAVGYAYAAVGELILTGLGFMTESTIGFLTASAIAWFWPVWAGAAIGLIALAGMAFYDKFVSSKIENSRKLVEEQFIDVTVNTAEEPESKIYEELRKTNEKTHAEKEIKQ